MNHKREHRTPPPLARAMGVGRQQQHIMHNMINNKSTVDMIYIVCSKAFDKVDHGILLHELTDLGIAGRLGLWFFHFLNNRQQYVRIPGGISQPHPVLSGMPQGTVRGPLLFFYYDY